MGKIIDITKKFGKLTILREWGKANTGGTKFICQCDCGNQKIVIGTALKAGFVKSCGCLVRRSPVNFCNTTQHGHSKKGNHTSEYNSWTQMKRRCYDKNSHNFPNYGAKGVIVCDRWMNFSLFLADMGLKPTKDHTIDRYPNVNGNYEPSNCRWATMYEQLTNKKNSRNYEYKGVVMSLRAWSRKFGFCNATIDKKLKIPNMTIQRIFSDYENKKGIAV